MLPALNNLQKPSAPRRAPQIIQAALAYQRILATNPTNAPALIGMSLLALAGRQTEHAIRLASAALAVNPRIASGWIALGQALKAAGRFADAEQAYHQALRLGAANPLARMGLGELKLASGHPAEAIPEFDIALRSKPSLACAHLCLGNALAILGNFIQALDHYRSALGIRPRYAEAEFAVGFALNRLGRTREAEARYRRAIVLKPRYAPAWINLGSLLREHGRDLAAEAALRRAIHLRPDLVSGWLNLAALERERRRFAAARECLCRALALDSAQIETLIAWCQLQLATRDISGAHEWARWAIAIDPNHAEAVNQCGIVLHNERRFTEAIVEFERAESLGSKGAASNRGNSLLELGRVTQALEAHRRAVDLDPENAGAKYNLALTQLRLGEWRSGWRAYESRWQFREVHRVPHTFTCPRWRGEPLTGQRILLHAEQGLGDSIQFSRYACLVVARGGFPILEVQPPVERLLLSLPIVRAGLAQVRALGTPRNDYDLECPLMSLPAVFATTVETVPWPGAYLGAEANDIGAKRTQFPSSHAGPRIGIAWAGNPRYRADAQRSMHLRTFSRLLHAIPANWISLQKGPAYEQIATLAVTTLPHYLHIVDGSSCDGDLAETSALMATLDLVITTDTCIAHLAGAIGKPVWILLPHLSDWRWMQQLESTPWYPTARLFRQPSPGDWAGVLDRVIGELCSHFWR
ncbi:MAG: tetratricopeptide repeat protein [Terracidiphilus sp.]